MGEVANSFKWIMCDLQTRNHFMRKSCLPGASFRKSKNWKVLIFSMEIWSVNCQCYEKSAIAINLRFQG